MGKNHSSLSDMDRSCIWHPFTQMQTAGPPIPIIKAKGLFLYAEDGSSYMDAISSWWVNLHGHAHPYIIEKVKIQMETLDHVIFADFTHSTAVELASRLLEILPGCMSKIFYSDNGSTAVETALKMAIQYWHNQNKPKRKVLCLKHSYHGDTFGAMSAAGKNEFNKPFWGHLFETIMIDPPFIDMHEHSLCQMKQVLTDENIACFIFEPLVMGSGGMITYPAKGLDALLKLCKQHNVLTIADEVMTGFGRTGPLFACEYLEESPDIICLSKGLTGGFLPLGATACTEEIFNVFLSTALRKALLHGHTYTANPIACSSALASLDLLQRTACTIQRERISSCHRKFCQTWNHHPKLKRCESIGTLLILEYSSANRSYFQSMRERLYRHFLDRGILLRPLGNVLYVMPPYCIQEDELTQIYDQITMTLGEP